MREMLMWTCSRGAANSICLCGECSVSNRTLSIWSRHFKEKYVCNAGHTFHLVNAKQRLTQPLYALRRKSSRKMWLRESFWHSFGFVSVPYASFAYRCGHTLTQMIIIRQPPKFYWTYRTSVPAHLLLPHSNRWRRSFNWALVAVLLASLRIL